MTSHNTNILGRTSSLRMLAAGALSFCSVAVTDAAPLHYQFSGLVSRVDETLGDAFAVGEPFQGFFSIESEDRQPDPLLGDFFASDLALTIGGDYVLSSPSGNMKVQNNWADGYADLFLVAFTGRFPERNHLIVGAPANGLAPVDFDLQFIFRDNSVFSSDSAPLSLPLPYGNPDLERSDFSNIDFGDDSGRLSFQVASVTAVSNRPDFTVVPESSSIALVVTGLVAGLCNRRIRRRCS